jgi:hypothetical protein
MIIIVKIADPPKNVLDPIELRKYLDSIRRQINESGAGVDDATGAGDIVAQFNKVLARLRELEIISSDPE